MLIPRVPSALVESVEPLGASRPVAWLVLALVAGLGCGLVALLARHEQRRYDAWYAEQDHPERTL